MATAALSGHPRGTYRWSRQMQASEASRRAVSTIRNPQPFAAAFEVRGRPAEVTHLIDELQSRLEELGWTLDESTRGRSPRRVIRLSADTQWIVMAVATPRPDRLCRPFEYELTVSGLVHNRSSLHEVVAAIPFTPLELELLAQDMPLTASIRERGAEWMPSLELNDHPLAGHGAIFTIHHQTDFVLLLERALELGLDSSLVTVIDKEYRYSLSRRVDAHLRRRLGVPVYRYSELKTGISRHLQRVTKARATAGAPTWTPTIVLDDGGYVLPLLLASFEPYLSLFKGVVEQTKSGIWKLRPYEHDLRVPIFSVAESELKATVEAHGVAQAALTSLRRLLPNEKFDGRRAVVVGYGVMGQALAELLRRNNIDVHITDTAPSMLVTARERGFQVGEALPDLVERIQPRYLFSCAEPGAVNADTLQRIRCDCALVSLTSRDVAFDKHALSALGSARSFGTVGTVYARDDPSCSILLVADGFPVNFHFSESMPNQQSDLIMASLLIGAITLARSPWPAGNDPRRSNAVLNEGTLLRDFLRLEPAIASDRGDR